MDFKVRVGNVNIGESRQGLATVLGCLGLQAKNINVHKSNDAQSNGVAIVAFETCEEAQAAGRAAASNSALGSKVLLDSGLETNKGPPPACRSRTLAMGPNPACWARSGP